MHWNLLKAPFGKSIFTVLAENDVLAVLDLSNNSMGIGVENCIEEINTFFTTNKTLVHLDISYNYFNYE